MKGFSVFSHFFFFNLNYFLYMIYLKHLQHKGFEWAPQLETISNVSLANSSMLE